MSVSASPKNPIAKPIAGKPERKRITARVPVTTLSALEEAATLVGASSINDFIVQAALEKAQRIIEEQRIIQLSMRDAETFFKALENPPAPNEKLIAAFARHKTLLGDAQN